MDLKLSCALVPQPGVEALARRAEELGYERVWFPDSPALYGDVWIAVAQAAAATRRIGLGTSVLIPSLRHVATTAAAIAHVEALAPGRLRVALGTGFTGRRMFGKRALPWKAVETYVRQLRGLLRGEEVEVDGRVCRLMHPEGVVAPRPIETPLWIAAGGPKGLGIAREVGDGLVCAGVVPEGAEDAALLTLGTVLRAGEGLDSPRVLDAVGPGMAVVWHGTYEAAGAGVDGLPGGAGWREEVERDPERERHRDAHEGHLVELRDRDRRHLRPELGAMTFTGTPDELRARCEQLRSQGVAELVYWPMGRDLDGELEAMAGALLAG